MTESTHPTPLDEEKLVEELANEMLCLYGFPPWTNIEAWHANKSVVESVRLAATKLIPLIRSDERSKCAEKWVSVETLPEKSGEYWGYLDVENGKHKRTLQDTVYFRLGCGWRYRYYGMDVIAKVTHYQPLPSPPIEEVKK